MCFWPNLRLNKAGQFSQPKYTAPLPTAISYDPPVPHHSSVNIEIAQKKANTPCSFNHTKNQAKGLKYCFFFSWNSGVGLLTISSKITYVCFHGSRSKVNNNKSRLLSLDKDRS